MKAGYKLFAFLAAFYGVLAVIYWALGGEALGITAIALSAALAATIGFYFFTNDKRMGLLPSDNDDGEIADLAGELGFFSPHSWWPLPLALSACAMGLGLVVGWWLTVIALGALVVSIIGFTTEYEKPGLSAHH
jgi:uncharacterized membrane protein